MSHLPDLSKVRVSFDFNRQAFFVLCGWKATLSMCFIGRLYLFKSQKNPGVLQFGNQKIKASLREIVRLNVS